MQDLRLIILRRAGTFSLWAGGLSILAMPVSISVSQAFYALALVSLMADSPAASFRSPAMRRLYIAIFVLYLTWFLSSVMHGVLERSPAPFVLLFHSDFKDVLLSGMAFWSFHHAAHSLERRRLLYRFLASGFLILLGSGLIAVFTPFRLSKIFYHMEHGWGFSGEARLQHPMFQIPVGPVAIVLHMPVGFMGTHLAYGAQLGFYFVPLALFSLDRFVRLPALRSPSRFEILIWLLTGLSIFVLLLNSARSALFGILSALLAGVLLLTGRNWKNRAWMLALPVALALMTVAGGLTLTGRTGYAREFIMQSVGLEKKHSDYQRVLLWSTVAGLIEDHPLMGTGPGRFPDAVLDRMDRRAGDQPYLWYLFMQAERGHAHNDFLYQLAVAGVPAGGAFLLFWFFALKRVFSMQPGLPERTELPPEHRRAQLMEPLPEESGEPRESSSSSSLLPANLDQLFSDFIPYAPVLLLFGGLFQCYFLDDQVLLPFWLMLGLAFHAREGMNHRG